MRSRRSRWGAALCTLAAATALSGLEASGATSLQACRVAVRGAANRLAAEVQVSLGSCLVSGLGCLFDAPDVERCCSEARPGCEDGIARIHLMRDRLAASLSGEACSAVTVDGLFNLEGVGYDHVLEACARLEPEVLPFDRRSLGDCLARLVLEDVVHRVAWYETPRGPDAAECIGIEDVLAEVRLFVPSTCEEGPVIGPTPTPTPSPTPSPIPTHSPMRTPGPGPSGCQSQVFGPCERAGFRACCSESQFCAPVFGQAKICVPGEPPPPTPRPSVTPAPSGSSSTPTPAASGTPSVTPSAPTPQPSPSPTPRPSPSPSPRPSPTPGPTATPGPTGQPGDPTSTPSPEPTPSPAPTMAPTCSGVTITAFMSFIPPTGVDVRGVAATTTYPGPKLAVSGQPQNLTGLNGVFSAGDDDVAVPGDGFNDTYSIGLFVSSGSVPPSAFASATFQCRPGATAPPASEFSCTSQVTQALGLLVPSTCSLQIDVTP